jgi:hypothetical protein
MTKKESCFGRTPDQVLQLVYSPLILGTALVELPWQTVDNLIRNINNQLLARIVKPEGASEEQH